MKQAERTFSSSAQGRIVDLVEEQVDQCFERLADLESKAAALTTHMAQADANTLQVGNQVALLSQTVEHRRVALRTEVKELTSSLKPHRAHTDDFIKQMDTAFYTRFKEMGAELVSQLGRNDRWQGRRWYGILK
eukprot:23832-Amphidinium_carterae.1